VKIVREVNEAAEMRLFVFWRESAKKIRREDLEAGIVVIECGREIDHGGGREENEKAGEKEENCDLYVSGNCGGWAHDNLVSLNPFAREMLLGLGVFVGKRSEASSE
jgi:hypothetical protein